MIQRDEPRETPDWMPTPATCPDCGRRDWHSCCTLDMPDCELGEN
jgi:hypothetical protein